MSPKKVQPQTVEKDFVQQSIRFQPHHLKWLTERAEAISGSLNAVVRQLVDDARAFYSLAPTMVETLEKDRATAASTTAATSRTCSPSAIESCSGRSSRPSARTRGNGEPSRSEGSHGSPGAVARTTQERVATRNRTAEG